MERERQREERFLPSLENGEHLIIHCVTSQADSLVHYTAAHLNTWGGIEGVEGGAGGYRGEGRGECIKAKGLAFFFFSSLNELERNV